MHLVLETNPKIHKEDTPLRPIIISIDSITCNISKLFASILAPLVQKNYTYTTYSTPPAFSTKSFNVKLTPEKTLVSSDVTLLFTWRPTSYAAEKRSGNASNKTNTGANSPQTKIFYCLYASYFKYKDQFQREKYGCAM